MFIYCFNLYTFVKFSPSKYFCDEFSQIIILHQAPKIHILNLPMLGTRCHVTRVLRVMSSNNSVGMAKALLGSEWMSSHKVHGSRCTA